MKRGVNLVCFVAFFSLLFLCAISSVTGLLIYTENIQSEFDLGNYSNSEFVDGGIKIASTNYSIRQCPDNQSYDSLTGINMSGNILLYHFDNGLEDVSPNNIHATAWSRSHIVCW